MCVCVCVLHTEHISFYADMEEDDEDGDSNNKEPVTKKPKT